MVNHYQDVVLSSPALVRFISRSSQVYEINVLTLTGIALTCSIRPQISRSHSCFNPSRETEKTSSLFVLATTRCPNSEAGVREHWTELVTDDGGWNVVTTFMFPRRRGRQR